MSPDISTVRVAFSKWGERPHWEYDAIRLGDDTHGTWLGRRSAVRRTGESSLAQKARRAMMTS